jgi:hypothetical protein
VDVTVEEDIATVAGQLADLTRTVEHMAGEMKTLRENADKRQLQADKRQLQADDQYALADTQQARIEQAARELADISERLQAAANALRESI